MDNLSIIIWGPWIFMNLVFLGIFLLGVFAYKGKLKFVIRKTDNEEENMKRLKRVGIVWMIISVIIIISVNFVFFYKIYPIIINVNTPLKAIPVYQNP